MKVNSESELQDISDAEDVYLTDDVEITGTFDTIDNFSGIFDGNGHTIYNLTDVLFDQFKGKLKDLHIQNIKFNSQNSGSLATEIQDAVIDNVNISMNTLLTSQTQFQSFAYKIKDSKLLNCDIQLRYKGNACFGIADSLRGTTLKKCSVNLDVSADMCAGIARQTITMSKQQRTSIQSCTTTGKIKSSKCAGLVTELHGTIKTCKSNVTIKTKLEDKNDQVLGGLVGIIKSGDIRNSIFSGRVLNTDPNVEAVGGIAAKNEKSIENCINTGTISTKSKAPTGGLIGVHEDGGSIESSKNTGTITGIEIVGGLVGKCNGKIAKSYNHSEINSESKNTLIGYTTDKTKLQKVYLIPIDTTQQTTYGSKTDTDPDSLKTILNI